MNAPGSYRTPVDRYGALPALARSVPEHALWVVDAKVARLHPSVLAAAKARSAKVVLQVAAGERVKSLRKLEQLALEAQSIPRSGAVVAVGGGTVGDVSTVLAHLLKRGVELVHVPTTVLAAVDSSVGGKGAVNVGEVKNALGVFHAPSLGLVCFELYDTLSPSQRREGLVEAYKMAVCLDATAWAKWSKAMPALREVIHVSRGMKSKLVAKDPYERTGLRALLNFGHTFGHVVESVTRYRVRHGEAVGLGVHCALDVGRALGVTSDAVAKQVESVFAEVAPNARVRLARALRPVGPDRLEVLLGADKKASAKALRMVLLERPGRARLVEISPSAWKQLLPWWQEGNRP